MLKTLRVALASLVVLFALLLVTRALVAYAPESLVGRLFGGLGAPADGAVSPQLAGLAITDRFRLVAPDGRVVTQADFAGKWQLVYFGYTSCPDICPTSLQVMAGALKAIGPLADRVAPLFITVDPGRDTPAALGRYTRLFDPRILGLGGSDAMVDAAEHSFRVYARKVPQPGTGSYLMDHTSFLYLIDPKGRLKALFDREVTAPALAERLRADLD